MLYQFFILVLIMAASTEAAFCFDVPDYWLQLLHYKRNWMGKIVSKIDDPLFFLHPDGKNNPKAEWEASIQVFNHPDAKRYGRFHSDAACVFPERFRYLKSQGLVFGTPLCPEFDEWKAAIDAESVSLVFSSSFPNNPSSMFGHTFLRFNKKNKQNDLLDYTAAYSAFIPAGDNGFQYVLKGLTGGYQGFFSLAPYYMKVNEYIHSESRDLFEYELAIDSDGLNRMIAHLWELYSAGSLNYFFIDENCSMVLGLVFDISVPEWNLSESSQWYYLPADLVKKMNAIPGAIRHSSFRPSVRKRLNARIHELSSDDQTHFAQLIHRTRMPSEERSIDVLNAVMLYSDFQKNLNKGVWATHDDEVVFRETLVARSQLGPDREAPDIPPSNRPENSHGPMQIRAEMRWVDHVPLTALHFKNGYHDLLSSDYGHTPFSRFDFLNISLERAQHHVSLTELSAVDIVSLHPSHVYDRRLSWAAGGGYLRNRIQGYGAAGLTHEFDPESRAMTALLLGAQNDVAMNSNAENALRPYLEWDLLYNPWKSPHGSFKLLGQARLLRDLWHWNRDWTWELRLSESLVLKKDIELRFHQNKDTHHDEWSSELVYNW